LTYFSEGPCQFTGTIPPSIGNWSLIEKALFSSNSFVGTMPKSICPFIDQDANYMPDPIFSLDGIDLLQVDCSFMENCSCCTGCTSSDPICQ
jgi:hypothetical protein